MRVSFTVTARGVLLFGVDPPGVIAAQWNRIKKAALWQALWVWWKYILPQKFQRGSRGKYPGVFFVRSRATQARKFRKFGHSLPLVTYPVGRPPADRDTFEKYVSNVPRISGTSRRARARWRAPKISKVYQDEARATNESDKRVMARAMHRFILRLLRGKGVRWRSKGPNPTGSLQRIRRLRIV